MVAAFAIWSLVWLSKSRLILSTIFLGASLATKASWLPLVPPIFHILCPQVCLSIINPYSGPSDYFGRIFFPFHPRLDLPIWLWQLFTQRLLPGESGFASVSAFNFWYLMFGQNLVPDSTWGINLIGPAIILTISGILGYRLWKKTGFFPPRFIFRHFVLCRVSLCHPHARKIFISPLSSSFSGIAHSLAGIFIGQPFIFNQSLLPMVRSFSPPLWFPLYSVQFTKMVSAVNLGLFATLTLWPRFWPRRSPEDR